MNYTEAKANLTLQSELRHLHPNLRIQLSRILDVADSWKDLAAIIQKPDIKENEPLFTANDICLLQDQKYRMSGSPTQALIEHWSTFGRKRPTISTLLELLEKCHLYRAADFISVDVLHGEPVPRKISTVPTEPTPVSIDIPQISNPTQTGPCFEDSSVDLPYTNLPHFSFNILKNATNNFNEISVKDGGNKLGQGAFGSVFLAYITQMNENVAVKIINDKINKQFVTELEILTVFQHENLLSMLGYSINGPKACLVYKYMGRGSLLDNLSLKDEQTPLFWIQRIKIALGAAKGIKHLHTFQETPYIHRDVKSANILLDEELNSKLGDFGLVRTGSRNMTSTAIVTSTVFGTTVYMAPEAFRGDVSVKLDVFSFGVVLYELLTSLAPFDADREETDILSHVEELDDVESLLDTNVGPWNQECANSMFKMASTCTNHVKRHRPTMNEVVIDLEKILKLTED